MIPHIHAGSSNSDKAILTFEGCRLAGLIRDRLPLDGTNTYQHTLTLVFECGWGLTFNKTGAYWLEKPTDVARAKQQIVDDLEEAVAELTREKERNGWQPDFGPTSEKGLE